MTQPTELQQVQAELNETALTLVRTQRQLDNVNKQSQLITSYIIALAKTRDIEVKTIEDIRVFLESFNLEDKDAE